MKQYKILFVGPVASGKTEAVKTLCGDNVLTTEVKPTDDVKNIKHETTVAMDYGTLPFGSEKKLHIYGAPGQGRFEFMLDILSEGCLGVIILVDLSTVTSEEHLYKIVGEYTRFIERMPFMVGFTHVDLADRAVAEQYRGALNNRYGGQDLTRCVDPRSRAEVARLVEEIVLRVK